MFRTKIGLEIHAQLRANAKLFSDTQIAGHLTQISPNSCINSIDLALPGTLPRFPLEYNVLRRVNLLAKVLKCQVNLQSRFDRKHYFYHDLPQGYQITQKYEPIARDGILKIFRDSDYQNATDIRISQLQLEQDTAKSIIMKSSSIADGHGDENHSGNRDVIAIDHNRAGIGLVEIVTLPDFESSFQVVQFIKKLSWILRSFDISDANMDEGSLRVDVNISISESGSKQDTLSPSSSQSSSPYQMGVKCEIKNLNSLKSVQDAIDAERERQIELKSSGGVVEACTLSFDDELGVTVPMRVKDELTDYRYIPDPELPPFGHLLDQISISAQLEDYTRYIDYEIESADSARSISPQLINNLRAIPGAFEYLMAICATLDDYVLQKRQKLQKYAANIIMNELQGEMVSRDITLARYQFEHERTGIQQDADDFVIPVDLVRGLAIAMEEKKIFHHHLKPIVCKYLDQSMKTSPSDTRFAVEDYVNKNSNLAEDKLRDVIDNILQSNPKTVSQLIKVQQNPQSAKSKKQLAKIEVFLMGQTMRALNQNADPAVVQSHLQQYLSEKYKL
ncbi:hypothetical protein MP228_000834 [Amoeboaphelidium protococcarum]|nr:hypothetical protein MP228_000834 [Amoeboaphelidium protococcarum]